MNIEYFVLFCLFPVRSSREPFSYKFEDGSIVSETGAFKINENTVTVFGQGHMRFEMRKKLYDFDFNVAENGVRATLS